MLKAVVMILLMKILKKRIRIRMMIKMTKKKISKMKLETEDLERLILIG